ncbi:hypothetical protein Lesp02_68460 [Lentzea sp. NBRC 105346]|uniref:hypothetical protein n=1 Tax=Lentzea sp. NBRC 105346 TaxID=3032205 RepID=UPI0024A4445D|nr:hypothetical protein [Lentzea sp. NBRC 105346]GLZ34659.1 hypothetical protein Lesp02_68460 [Lentzea sp. NBRC 105346]
MVLTYSLYVLISVGLTVWVGHVLSSNGKVFLIDVFRGNEELAVTVNRLLVVGFYLVNLGFVSWYLRTTDVVEDPRQVFETLSVKIGTVLLVLGILHITNVIVLGKMRRRSILDTQAEPPVAPTGHTVTA